MSKKLLSRLLAGFLAGVLAASSMVVAGAANHDQDGTGTAMMTKAEVNSPTHAWYDASSNLALFVNGGTVNINPVNGTSKVAAKTVQLTADAWYGIEGFEYTDSYDVTASADVKWYVGPSDGSNDPITSIGAPTDMTVDDDGTYIKTSAKGVVTRQTKGNAISVSKGKVTAVATADSFSAERTSITEYVKLYAYDKVTKTETLMHEIPVTVYYALKDLKYTGTNFTYEKADDKWPTTVAKIGDPKLIRIGAEDTNGGLAKENTYTIKTDVPGALSFAIDKTAGGDNLADDGELVAGDTGWLPFLTGVSQDDVKHLMYRAQGLKDVVQAGLLNLNKSWIQNATKTFKYSDGAQNTGVIIEGKTWAAYETAYDAQVQKLKDKATAANIIILNEQSGKSLKLKVTVNNSATTDNDAYKSTDVQPVSVAIAKTGTTKTTEMIDFYTKNAIISDVEVLNEADLTSVTDFSEGTTTITDKATVIVIQDNATFDNATELMALNSGTSADGDQIIKNKLMKLSKTVYNFGLVTSTTDTTKYKKFTGASVTAKMAGNNAQLLLSVSPKNLTGNTQFATVIVAYGEKFAEADTTDAKLFDNIVVVPLKIHNGEAGAATLTKILIGSKSISVDTDAETTGNQTAPGSTTVTGLAALSGELKFTTTPASVAPKAVTVDAGAGTITRANSKYTVTMAKDQNIKFTVTFAGYNAAGIAATSEDVEYTFDLIGADCDDPIGDMNEPTWVTRLEEDDLTVVIGTADATLGTVLAETPNGGQLGYKWYYSDAEDGSNASEITGKTTATLSLTAEEVGSLLGVANTDVDKYIYVIASNTSDGKTSYKKSTTVRKIEFQVPAVAPSITGNLTGAIDADTAEDKPLSITATSLDGGELSYQWYQSTDGNGLQSNDNKVGGNSNSYTVPKEDLQAVPSNSLLLVVCVVTNTAPNGQTATTDSTICYITPKTYSAVPTWVEGKELDTADLNADNYYSTFTLGPVEAVSTDETDGGTITYKWHFSNSESDTVGTGISGGTNATLSIEGDDLLSKLGVEASEVPQVKYIYVEAINTVSGKEPKSLKSAMKEVTFVQGPLGATIENNISSLEQSVASPLVLYVDANSSTDSSALSFKWYMSDTKATILENPPLVTGEGGATIANTEIDEGNQYKLKSTLTIDSGTLSGKLTGDVDTFYITCVVTTALNGTTKDVPCNVITVTLKAATG
jgi:hypothetical protein